MGFGVLFRMSARMDFTVSVLDYQFISLILSPFLTSIFSTFASMYELNFPRYSFRFKNSENKTFVLDLLRKKFVLLSPEEWVRQNVIQFLMTEKKYPKHLLNAEKKLVINGLTKRYDLIAFHPTGKVNLIVECKSPTIKINQESFDQIARYNLVVNAEYLMVTNGLQHYYCQMDYPNKKYKFLPELPEYVRKS